MSGGGLKGSIPRDFWGRPDNHMHPTLCLARQTMLVPSCGAVCAAYSNKIRINVVQMCILRVANKAPSRGGRTTELPWKLENICRLLFLRFEGKTFEMAVQFAYKTTS